MNNPDIISCHVRDVHFPGSAVPASRVLQCPPPKGHLPGVFNPGSGIKPQYLFPFICLTGLSPVRNQRDAAQLGTFEDNVDKSGRNLL